MIALDRQPTDMNGLAAAAFDAIKPLADERDITLAHVASPGLPLLWADSVRLGEVLRDLLTSAVELTPRGGSVCLALRVEDDQMILSVEGSVGPDLGEATPRASTEDTGPTLTLARRRVELHGGTLTVKRAPGLAWTFTASLPLRPPDSDRGASQDVAPPVPRGGILIVEDNPPSRVLVRAILERLGLPFAEASTLDEAKAPLAERVPDLVVTDLMFVGGGGAALLAHIRAEPTLRAIPVVVATAYARPFDRKRLLVAGFDDYTSKPIDIAPFRALVESLLRTGRRQQ